jgi:hypothetical protein
MERFIAIQSTPPSTQRRKDTKKKERTAQEKSVASVPSVVAIFAVRQDAQHFSQVSNAHLLNANLPAAQFVIRINIWGRTT